MQENNTRAKKRAKHFSSSFVQFLSRSILNRSTHLHKHGSNRDLTGKQTYLEPFMEPFEGVRGNAIPINIQNVMVLLGTGPVETQY